MERNAPTDARTHQAGVGEAGEAAAEHAGGAPEAEAAARGGRGLEVRVLPEVHFVHEGQNLQHGLRSGGRRVWGVGGWGLVVRVVVFLWGPLAVCVCTCG